MNVVPQEKTQQSACKTQESACLVSYPIARAYEAEHDSKWGNVRMPAVTNIVVQKPKVAACRKKTNCYHITYTLLECRLVLKVSFNKQLRISATIFPS